MPKPIDIPTHVRAPKPPIEQDDGKKGLPKGPTGQGQLETPQKRLRWWPTGQGQLEPPQGRLRWRSDFPPTPIKTEGGPAKAIVPPKVTGQIGATLGEDIAAKVATGQQTFTPKLRQQVQQQFPPQTEPAKPFAATIEQVGPSFTLGKDLPTDIGQAMAYLTFRPQEFQGFVATRDAMGNVIGLRDVAGNVIEDAALFDQFVFMDTAKQMSQQVWKDWRQNQTAIAGSTLDPAGIQAAEGYLAGMESVTIQWNDLTLQLETISQQRTFTVNEFNAAVAKGDMAEAKRHSTELERIDRERLALQGREQKLGLLALIAQNPAILFYAKQAGMLGQFADLGIDIDTLTAPTSGRVNIQYLTQLKQIDPAAYKQTMFALQAESGMSEQEVLAQLTAQSPGATAGRPTQRTL